MKPKCIELDVDYVGSQDPALQPTAEDFARLSEYLKVHRAQNEKLIAEARQVAATQPRPSRKKTAA